MIVSVSVECKDKGKHKESECLADTIFKPNKRRAKCSASRPDKCSVPLWMIMSL